MYRDELTNLPYLKEMLGDSAFYPTAEEIAEDEDADFRYMDKRANHLHMILRARWLRTGHPIRLYTGTFDRERNDFMVMVYDNTSGQRTSLWNPRSDSGFAWGYSGSGPHTLASALICDLLGEKPNEGDFYDDRTLATVAHHDLVFGLIDRLANQDHEAFAYWRFDSEFLHTWLHGWIERNGEAFEALCYRLARYLGRYHAHLAKNA